MWAMVCVAGQMAHFEQCFHRFGCESVACADGGVAAGGGDFLGGGAGDPVVLLDAGDPDEPEREGVAAAAVCGSAAQGIVVGGVEAGGGRRGAWRGSGAEEPRMDTNGRESGARCGCGTWAGRPCHFRAT